MKKLIIFIFVLLFIGSTSATLLLLHPTKIEFNGNVNEKICQKVNVFSDYRGNLIAKIKWAKKDSKNLNDYNINSTSLGIANNFSEKIISNNDKKEVEVCLTFEKPGQYYGALLYNTEIGPAGAGIWVYANIKGDGNGLDLTKITGNVIINLKSVINDNIMKNSRNQKALLMSSTTMLLFIFFILLLFVEKRVEKDYEEGEGEAEKDSLNAEIKNKKKPTKK